MSTLKQVAEERDHFKRCFLELGEQYASLKQQLAQAQAACEDRLDLQNDEFKRIKAITHDDEIKGLCQRAITRIEQHTPVIVQRDKAVAEAAKLQAQLEEQKKLRRLGCEDAAHDDVCIREICKPYLTEFELNGDSYGVPGIIDVVETTVKKLQAQCAAMREALVYTQPFVPVTDKGYYHPARCKIDTALSTNAGQDLLDKLQRYEKALEWYSLLSENNEVAREALKGSK